MCIPLIGEISTIQTALVRKLHVFSKRQSEHTWLRRPQYQQAGPQVPQFYIYRWAPQCTVKVLQSLDAVLCSHHFPMREWWECSASQQLWIRQQGFSTALVFNTSQCRMPWWSRLVVSDDSSGEVGTDSGAIVFCGWACQVSLSRPSCTHWQGVHCRRGESLFQQGFKGTSRARWAPWRAPWTLVMLDILDACVTRFTTSSFSPTW